MSLFTIHHELIADRTEEAWYRIMVSGPSFHYRWSHGTGADGPFSYISTEHHSHAVCREEPSLTMSWGMDVHDRDDRLQFDWARNFVNPTVRLIWVDFFWNNALIDRVELGVIDGAHGVIPIPDVNMRVTDFEVAVAYLVHGLDGAPSHDHPGRYLDTIGAKREPDIPRLGAGSE